MHKYGEILFIGKCNLNCYFCLSHEMDKIKSLSEGQISIPFEQWNAFYDFINQCKLSSIDTIYLSSTITEPLLYLYLPSLITTLQRYGFKVGIRSNATPCAHLNTAIALCDEEISFSLQSLIPETFEKITGRLLMPDWTGIFRTLKAHQKKCRISIVVNKYNEKEIPEILEFLKRRKKNISYVQLRRIYRYGQEDTPESEAYNHVVSWMKENYTKSGNYYESEIYSCDGLKVSLWNDVFTKESIQSVNYFTDGVISTNNLLIPAYEKGEIN